MEILILGNHRNALTVARRLGKQHRVILGGSEGVGRVERSRFVAETWSLPDASNDCFTDSLESLLQKSSDTPVLFPIGDTELFALHQLPSILDGRVRAVMPAPRIVAGCLDKAAIVSLASSLQIPQADYRKVKQLSDLRKAVEDVGCPCIIKSANQLSLAFGKKAYLVKNPDEVAALTTKKLEPEHGLIVQALAAGLRHNVYFAADRGRLVGAMEARVLRTNIFDGSGFTVESRAVPLSGALLRHTERLVEALDYHGIGNTQFLIDQQKGGTSFLEISPRMGAAFAITVPCGFDFANAGLCLALGDPVRREFVPRNYPAGRRFAWSYGDLIGLINATRSREISAAQAGKWLWRIASAAVTADIHATWSWRDPRPALANAHAILGMFWRYVTPLKRARHRR